MSFLVEEIRNFLDDTDGDRWKDRRLLYLLNEAQKDIAKRTGVLRKRHYFGVRDEQYLYPLPKDVYIITRVDYKGCNLPYKSHSDMDVCNCGCGIGTPTNAISDKHNRRELAICPAPATTDTIIYEADTLYGFHTELSKTFYGTTLDIETKIPIISGTPLGILRGILIDDLVVCVHYRALPRQLLTLEDELEIQDVDTLIQHYVCSKLLRSDRDSNSRALGTEEYQLYEKGIRELKIEVSKNFNSADYLIIPYRRLG